MFKNSRRSCRRLGSALVVGFFPLLLQAKGLEYQGVLTPESSFAKMGDSIAAIQCKLWTENTDKIGQVLVEWCGQGIDLPKINATKQRITFHECKKKLKHRPASAFEHERETVFILHLAHDSDAFVHFCCFKPRDKMEEKLGDLNILKED